MLTCLYAGLFHGLPTVSTPAGNSAILTVAGSCSVAQLLRRLHLIFVHLSRKNESTWVDGDNGDAMVSRRMEGRKKKREYRNAKTGV